MIQSIVLEWLFLTVQVTSKVRTFNTRTNTAFREINGKGIVYTIFYKARKAAVLMFHWLVLAEITC
jgi:hypothetical protein